MQGKAITLGILTRDDPAPFALHPGDEQLPVMLKVADLKEMLLAINVAYSRIQALAKENAAAEQRIARLEELHSISY